MPPQGDTGTWQEQAHTVVQKCHPGFYLSSRMLIHRLTLAGQSPEWVGSAVCPFPLGCQTREGEAESRMNWFRRALVQLGILDVLQLLERD